MQHGHVTLNQRSDYDSQQTARIDAHIDVECDIDVASHAAANIDDCFAAHDLQAANVASRLETHQT